MCLLWLKKYYFSFPLLTKENFYEILSYRIKKCQKTISVPWHFTDSGEESPGYQTFLLLNLYQVQVFCYTS